MELLEPINYVEIPGLEHYPHVTYTWVVMAVLFAVGFALKGSLRLAPSGLQNLVEAFVLGVYDFADSIMGKEGRPYFPLIGTLAMFILCANLVGLLPGAVSPTANVNTNAAMAVMVFLLYQYVGLKTHGLHYLKSFMGPVWWMTPLMLPVELLSHIGRPITLTLRLFGNVRGEELVLLVLGMLAAMIGLKGLILPMPLIAFAVFTSVVQTLVFCLLSMVYIAGALEEPH